MADPFDPERPAYSYMDFQYSETESYSYGGPTPAGMIPFPLPPEPPMPYRIVWPDLEHHATALGYLCMAFANLEQNMGLLLERLLNCSIEARRSIVEASGQSITARCDLLLRLASINPFSREWYEDTDVVLSEIKNISPQRNRLVHDPWGSQGYGTTPQQTDWRIKLHKPRSREPQQLTEPVVTERSLESIWKLSERITLCTIALHHLSVELPPPGVTQHPTPFGPGLPEGIRTMLGLPPRERAPWPEPPGQS